MDFPITKRAVSRFERILSDTTGRSLIQKLSIPEPQAPLDELYFLRIVNWSYVLFFEAGSHSIRHILSLIRALDPNNHQYVSHTRQTIRILRTYYSHNLGTEDRRDIYIRERAELWLEQYSGDDNVWENLCAVLCERITLSIEMLVDTWIELTSSPDDADNAIADLLNAVDNAWEPHVFDAFVVESAQMIGLTGLDPVKFRQNRFEAWRDLALLFDDRESARAAVRGAIRQELYRTFGADSEDV